MALTHKILFLTVAFGLAACQNPDRYGTGSPLDPNAGGIATGPLGDPSDPRSIAYFNQSVGDRVFFALNQSTLSEQARVTLVAQAQWLTANPDYAVIIEGHADEQGTREYNLALGARRASAVQDFLISQGVSAARMRTVSYGKERPVAVCPNESCFSQNRRAVTVLSMGVGA